MNLSRRSAIKTIGVVSAGSALSGTALAVNEHEDDERDPDDAPDEDEDVGAIRFGHFSPDAPDVDIYVDDDQILADVGYDELSPYLEIAPGTYGVTVTAAGDPETVVYEETIPVDASYYTAVAIGELEGDGDDLEEDAAGDEDDGYAADTDEDDIDDYDEGDSYDEGDGEYENGDELDDNGDGDDAAEPDDEPDTGTFEVMLLVDNEPDDVQDETAEIRVVHASPNTPDVDVVDGESGLTVFEDVAFGVPSGYVPVDPGERTLELFPTDENGLGNGLEDDADDEAGVDDETDDDEADGVDEDDLIEPDDPVATAEIDLEEGYPYTAFAIGYLDADELDDEMVSDDELEDEDDEFDDEDDELDDEYDDTDEMAGEDELEDEEDDRSFDVVLAIDGTTEADDDELEPEEEELEPEAGSEPEDVFETDDEDDDDEDEYESDDEDETVDEEDPAEA